MSTINPESLESQQVYPMSMFNEINKHFDVAGNLECIWCGAMITPCDQDESGLCIDCRAEE